MWKKMLEARVWVFAAIDLAVSLGLAQAVVQWGDCRWSWGMTSALDASASIVAFTCAFGVMLPIIGFFASVVIAVEGQKLLPRN